jgi:carboxylesterase type B
MRRLRTLVPCLAVALAATLAGCDLAPVPGDSPLRYRDEVFTDVELTSDVTYGHAVDQEGETVSLELDVYEPAGDDAEARPLIVWVHGGSFAFGNKTSPEIVDEAQAFARKGYVNASIEYRLSEKGCTSVTAECLIAIGQAREDAQAAVRFLREHAADYGIDPERVAIAGTSAGAITALGVGFITDDEEAQVDAAVSLSGAVIFTGSVDEGDAASLLFHGTADNLVPYAWAQDTLEAAQAAGVISYLVTWEGQGHVPYVAHRDQIIDLTTNFLYRRLDAAGAEQ